MDNGFMKSEDSNHQPHILRNGYSRRMLRCRGEKKLWENGWCSNARQQLTKHGNK